MAEEWLTYSQLGERLGVSAEAARQKAIRLRLRRQTANDGKAQCLVDVEDVRAGTVPRKGKDDRTTPDEQPADARLLEALDGHIASLKEIVAREQARADGLQTRLDALLDERASDGRRTGELEQAITELRSKIQALDARPAPRPWWHRLAG